VTPVLNDARNPAALIKKLCKPEDVVIFKLDVDSEKVELGIMDQIVNDPELRGLVDEFFFEMHVCNKVMRMHGMDCTERSTFHVSGWYDVAMPAREKGLRMHYWP
jgi:hypothetical protein